MKKNPLDIKKHKNIKIKIIVYFGENECPNAWLAVYGQ